MGQLSQGIWTKIRNWVQKETMRPDLARATRGTAAFMGAFLATWHLGWPSVAVFAAMAAQNIAMIDVKGDYRARFCLLLAMLFVVTGSVVLGAAAWAGGLPMMLICTTLIAASNGLWRHLSSDYGPGTAIVSALLFFVSLSQEAHGGHVVPAVVAALAGGGLGLFLQVILWPWRAQHPLRRAVADSWLAMAALFDAVSENNTNPARQAPALREAEGALRSAIDQTDRTLTAARSLDAGGTRHAKKRATLIAQLIELNLWVARLAVAANAVHTLLDGSSARSAKEGPGQDWRAQFSILAAPLFTGLTSLGRTVALAVVSHQPGHLAACEVWLRRLDGILRGLDARAMALRSTMDAAADAKNAGSSVAAAEIEHVAELLREVGRRLSGVEAALRLTMERADERAAFPLELLELKTWQLRPLAAAINLKPRLDPILLRFTLRLMVLLAGGVTAFHLLGFPHGYWLPLTIVMVLQPDYGTTRTRAAQRLTGTMAGSLLASGLLWLQLPPGAMLGVIAISVFLFCYLLRRNYAVAAFFVTLFVVLLVGGAGAQTVSVALERTGATLAGGVIALGAAALFWPVWEKDRLPPLMAGALRANRRYFAVLMARLAHDGMVDDELIQAKRGAEAANTIILASLRRFYGDPRNRRDRLEMAAALANGTQRLTRIASVLMLQVRRAGETDKKNAFLPAHATAMQCIMDAMDALGDKIARGLNADHACEQGRSTLAAHALALDTLELPPAADSASSWASTALARAIVEARGLIAELDTISD